MRGRRGLLSENILHHLDFTYVSSAGLLACSLSSGGLGQRTAERAGCCPLRWGSWAVYGRVRQLLPPSSNSILLGTFLKFLQRSYLGTFPKFLQRSQQLVWWKLPSSTYISREVHPVNILTHGRWNKNNQETNDQSISRNYSREEWQNLSQPERNRIYHAHNRLETARTVAAMLREQNDNRNDDISMITPSVQNLGAINQQTGSGDNGNQQSVAQVSLQGISQAMNRRGIGAYSTGRKKEYLISAISKEFTSNHSCRAE
jgi:hypothetical protein